MTDELERMYATAAAEPYLPEHRPEAQQRVDGVIIDPSLRRSFEATDNADRDRQEIADWWEVPFIVTQTGTDPQWLKHWPEGTRYDVRCLDGGAWDRSTWRGSFPNLDAAIDASKTLSGKSGRAIEERLQRLKRLEGNDF